MKGLKFVLNPKPHHPYKTQKALHSSEGFYILCFGGASRPSPIHYYLLLLTSIRELLFMILEHIKLIVSALLLKKLVVIALLDYLTVGKQDDIIGVLDG